MSTDAVIDVAGCGRPAPPARLRAGRRVVVAGGEAIDLLGTLRGGLDDKRRADLIEQFELDRPSADASTRRATARRSRSSPRSLRTWSC